MNGLRAEIHESRLLYNSNLKTKSRTFEVPWPRRLAKSDSSLIVVPFLASFDLAFCAALSALALRFASILAICASFNPSNEVDFPPLPCSSDSSFSPSLDFEFVLLLLLLLLKLLDEFKFNLFEVKYNSFASERDNWITKLYAKITCWVVCKS